MANCAEFSRAPTNQGMYPDVANLKKRKFFGGAVDELNLPAPKHKCCEVSNGSEDESLITEVLDRKDIHTLLNDVDDVMDLLDLRVKYAQDSRSFPRDSHSYAEAKVLARFGKSSSHDEASISWSNSERCLPRSESRTGRSVGDVEEEVISSQGKSYPCQNKGWNDIDCLEEGLSAEHCQQQTTEGLEEFLSSSGMNPNLFMQSTERWTVDQEVQLARQRPTIDLEFEQYFSMLML